MSPNFAHTIGRITGYLRFVPKLNRFHVDVGTTILAALQFIGREAVEFVFQQKALEIRGQLKIFIFRSPWFPGPRFLFGDGFRVS